MYRGHAGADMINEGLQGLLNPDGQEIQRGAKGVIACGARGGDDLHLAGGPNTFGDLGHDTALGVTRETFGSGEIDGAPCPLKLLDNTGGPHAATGDERNITDSRWESGVS